MNAACIFCFGAGAVFMLIVCMAAEHHHTKRRHLRFNPRPMRLTRN